MSRHIRRGAIFARAIHKSFREFARRKKVLGRDPSATERAEWLMGACRGVLASLGVEVNVRGSMPPSGLIVSNHLSYLDILCYGSLAPCTFVSKSEVRGWPVFGRLATNGGTIYIDRESKADAMRVAKEMEDALRAGSRIVLFPEGTSTGGDEVLKFHAPLFEAAIRAGVPITPACISYEIEGGDARKDVCYWADMTFAPHFLGLLGKGKIRASIAIGSAREHVGDRKRAGKLLYEDVVELHSALKDSRGSMHAIQNR
jgi:1-acyl-sn-glycerol-3-phosphate acyltransferase